MSEWIACNISTYKSSDFFYPPIILYVASSNALLRLTVVAGESLFQREIFLPEINWNEIIPTKINWYEINWIGINLFQLAILDLESNIELHPVDPPGISRIDGIDIVQSFLIAQADLYFAKV